ncbi:DNA-binding response regulator [Mycolicibacterium sp. P9-64]|uniref:response regulator transcription factor n=1 Tax=Mycolicibacterium sp. P9-64 TaxID=2024612 RepID=UPI001259D51A|nr:response regulator transcription factor [Mycolicibacterium sp. P9-64]KAA0077214.1 DNA-binding response regulator [Mycolicibacterium sp. P9-64]
MRLPHDYVDGRQIKTLIVDAEHVVADMLSLALSYEGAHTIAVHDGDAAISTVRQFRPDLVILDARLPDVDGMALMRRLADGQPNLPSILLQPKPAGAHRSPRNTGHDDWLDKPFSIEDALSRIRLTLHNNGIRHPAVRTVSSVGELVLDEQDRSVRRAGDPIVLGPKEFDLLRFFVRNACRVLSSREILGRVWPYDYAGRPSQVRLYVSCLRKRIDDGRTPMIHTLRGTGYVFKP